MALLKEFMLALVAFVQARLQELNFERNILRKKHAYPSVSVFSFGFLLYQALKTCIYII